MYWPCTRRVDDGLNTRGAVGMRTARSTSTRGRFTDCSPSTRCKPSSEDRNEGRAAEGWLLGRWGSRTLALVCGRGGPGCFSCGSGDTGATASGRDSYKVFLFECEGTSERGDDDIPPSRGLGLEARNVNFSASRCRIQPCFVAAVTSMLLPCKRCRENNACAAMKPSMTPAEQTHTLAIRVC